MHNLFLVFVSIILMVSKVRADVGQPCPHLTLKHGLKPLQWEIEKLVPSPSMLSVIPGCNDSGEILLVNYSPICEVVPGVPVFLISAIAPLPRGDIVQLKWYMPYIERSELIARALIDGKVHRDLSTMPEFVRNAATQAQDAFVIDGKLDNGYLLVTKQKSPFPNINQDLTVFSLLHKRDFEPLLRKLEICVK
jgi:hypothetical protein